jgi:hypothetical protein
VGLAGTACGCGGGKSNADRVSCRSNLIDHANAAVVERYFAQGKLGSRETVQRELGRGGASIFDDTGAMIPYAHLSRALRGQFNRWMYANPRVVRITRSAQRQATREASQRADREC